MINAGICPKCDKPLSYVKAERIAVGPSSSQIEWHGVSFICPSCSSILSVSIDPVELKAWKWQAVAEIQTYVRLSSEQSVKQAMHETTQEVDRLLRIRLKQNPTRRQRTFNQR
jgi:hypothetical protein